MKELRPRNLRILRIRNTGIYCTLYRLSNKVKWKDSSDIATWDSPQSGGWEDSISGRCPRRSSCCSHSRCTNLNKLLANHHRQVFAFCSRTWVHLLFLQIPLPTCNFAGSLLTKVCYSTNRHTCTGSFRVFQHFVWKVHKKIEFCWSRLLIFKY